MISVLVVDDNLELAENLAEILEDEGCEVALANSGEEALQVSEARCFDLVLTDIRMPGINGVELVRRLSARDPRAKFLLMTAYTSDSLLREAQTLGVVRAVLAKPLAIQQLLAMLPRDGGTSVLLVEDDVGLAAMIGESMRVHGFSVEVAPSSEGAREAVRRRRPDVAVIDLKLSDGGGTQLARELSGAVAVAGLPTMPVVVITGMGREGAEAQIELGHLAGGGVQFLSKPFAAESLLSALQNAVQGG